MKTRKKICSRIFKRYQKAGKKGKAKLLDEYAQTLGYNRDYLAHLLTNWGKTRHAIADGKPVKFVAKAPAKGRKKAPGSKKTGRPVTYSTAFVNVLSEIWVLFDCQCGKLLAPLIRGMMGFLVAGFGINEQFRALFETASPSTTGRKLKKEKERFRLKGIRTTKPGSLLKSQIPVKACFHRDERNPGFFEIDTSDFSPLPLRGEGSRPVLPDLDRHRCRFRLD